MQHSELYNELVSKNRGRFQRFFFAAFFVILLYKLCAALLISQVGMNPIRYQEIDPTYWLFMIAGIPGRITGAVAIVFDIVLLGSCLASAVFPKQRLTAVIFFCCYFLYFVLFNMTAGHHYANIAIVVIGFAFLFKDKFLGFAVQFSRFAFLFIMCSAALWKITRGNLVYPHQLEMIMLSHNAGILTAGHYSLKEQIIKWFIQHPAWSHAVWVLLIAMEFSFIAGFFTMKLDKLLFIIYFLFVIGGWLLAGIFAIENLLFPFLLYPAVQFIARNRNQKTYRPV